MLRFICALLLALLIAVPCTAKEPLRIVDGYVKKVADGDTITVFADGTKLKVRLYGIDAPETEKRNRKSGRVSKPGQLFGVEAFKALETKVYRQMVRLEIIDIDQYKRFVAVVWIGNRNINREMVTEGFAWAYRQYLDRPHASEYIEAEEQARKERRGLWQQYNPQPPWEFRKSLKREKHVRSDW